MTKVKKLLIAGLAAVSALSAQSLAKATLNAGIPAAASQDTDDEYTYVGSYYKHVEMPVTMKSGESTATFSGVFEAPSDFNGIPVDAIKVTEIFVLEAERIDSKGEAIIIQGDPYMTEKDINVTNGSDKNYSTAAEYSGTVSFDSPWKADVTVRVSVTIEYTMYRRAKSPAGGDSSTSVSTTSSEESSSTEAALLNGKNQDIYVPLGQRDEITVDRILDGIKAKDMFGADVQYTVPDADKAAVNFNQVGDYVLHLTATDAYGQTATATVTIKVIQSPSAPVFSWVDGKEPDVLNGKYKVGYSKGITNDYIFQKIKVADPDGTVVFISMGVMDDKGGTAIDADHPYALTADQAKTAATIDVIVQAFDDDGNIGFKDIPFVVVDDVAPVLTKADGSAIADGETVNVGFEAFKNEDQAKQAFINGFKAADAVDGTTAIALENYPAKADIRFQDGAADYTVNVTSADKAGNKASKAVKLHITASGDGTVTPTDPNKPGSGNDSNGDGIPDNYTAPVFYISDTLIAATADNPLTSAQISNIVNKAIFASEGANPLDLKIEDAAYIDHATESGIYDVNFSYVSGKEGADASVRTQGKIKVMVTGNDIVAPKNGWEAFCRWFTDGFQCLGNWITGHGWKTNYQLRIETYSK